MHRGRMLALVSLSGATAMVSLSATARTSTAQSEPFPNDMKLKQVQIVFRHGARAPLTHKHWGATEWDVCGQYCNMVPVAVTHVDGGPAPNSAWNQRQVDKVLRGGCSVGELTLIGQQQALEYGQWLRRRYVEDAGFLPPDFQPGLLKGRTTNFSRTTATLQGILTGLYPGTQEAIEVTTADDVDEVLYQNQGSCEKLRLLVKGLLQDLITQQQNCPDTQRLMSQVRSLLSIPADDKVNFTEVHDALTCMGTHGKQLPKGTTPQLLEAVNKEATKKMLQLVAPQASATENHREVLRLGLGILLQMVMANMEAAQAGVGTGEGGPQLYLYSGHDTTLMPLLVALGTDVTHWPPYLSNLIFELWEKAGPDSRGHPQYYVRVLYNKEVLPLRHCGAGWVCDLDTFRDKVVGDYLITRDQHAQQCLVKFSHDEPGGQAVEVASGSAVQEV